MEAFGAPQPTQPTEPKTTNWPKIILVTVLGLALLAGSAYAGYWYGTQEISNLKDQISNLRAELAGEAGQPKTQNQITPTPTPAPLFEPTPTPTQPITDPTAGWKTYTISFINASFRYPSNLEIASDVHDSTALAADHEYWVLVGGSDILYLATFLYKSSKTPTDWWNTEGKNKFETLADGVESFMSPKPSVNLTYSTKQTTFAGKQALEVVVSSDYESPHTPKQRFLTIIQQKGYIVMISYHEHGTTSPSIDISKQILSTFKFLD